MDGGLYSFGVNLAPQLVLNLHAREKCRRLGVLVRVQFNLVSSHLLPFLAQYTDDVESRTAAQSQQSKLDRLGAAVAVSVIHHQGMARARLSNELPAGAFHRGQTHFTFNHVSPRSIS